MRQLNAMDKLLLTFATVMGAMIIFSAGVEAERGDFFQTATGIVTGLFFIGIVFVVISERIRTLRDRLTAAERDLEALRPKPQVEVPEHPFPPELRELMEEIAHDAKQHAHDHDMLNAILKDLNLEGDKKPTPKQLEQIKAAFHENTDRYIDFEDAGDGKLNVLFSDKPFPAKKPTKIHVKDGDAEAKKRAERNAKRRAARQAAKGGETTTTTTTNPDQTSLV